MSFKEDFDVFVGGTPGIFKGIKIGQTDSVQKNLKSLSSIGDEDEITAVSWGDVEEKEILIASGTRETRSVTVYDTEGMSFNRKFVCNIGKGNINGILPYDGGILTAVHSGEIKLWKCNAKEEFVLNAGDKLHKMRHSNANKYVIATGGQENKLKLFDLEKKVQIFCEKNVPHDFLNLRVPIWISDIAFLRNSDKIATVSRYGHVRLYDPAAQRRPVINMETKDEPLTALTVPTGGTQIIVGSGKGMMKMIDLRNMGKIVHTYKGLVGSVTGLACSEAGPYVVSTSLDRYLRVHNINTREMIKKIYLTSKLTCLVLRSSFSVETQDDNNEISKDNYKISNNNDNEVTCVNVKSKDVNGDLEYDALFDKMEVITSKHNSVRLSNSGRKRSKSTLLSDSSERKTLKMESNWKVESIEDDVKNK